MKRRSFIASVSGAVGASALGAAPDAANSTAPLARRALGKTGLTLPVVGFPGLAFRTCDQAGATKALKRSMDAGVDYFDVAPAYGRDGECEIKMGEGLKGVARDSYFLACKTQMDDAKGAREELERSLKRLKTDHFDLYQLHCLQRPEEVKQALGPGGAMETILKAKEEGKIKHIGFSAHTTKAALAAMEGFDFETCMFPINFVEFYQTGFGKEVIELAAKKGVSLISIKPVSRGKWPEGVKKTYEWWYRPLEDRNETDLAMDWVLSQPNMVTTLPTSFLDVFDRTVAAARRFRKIAGDGEAELQKLAGNCVPIFRNDMIQKAAADLRLPGLPAYPARRFRI